ncbi:MAG: ATP-binding protein [Polyangiales bacterium]
MKEVSGKLLGLFARAAEHIGFDQHPLFEGLPFQAGDDPERIDWDTFCTLNERLQAVCEPHASLDEVGELLFEVPRMKRVCAAVQLVASPSMLYWTGHMWAAPASIRNVDCQYEELSTDTLRLTATIREHYRDLPALFVINLGAMRAMPRLLGLPDARVEMDLRPRRAVYTVHLPPSLTVWARLRRGVRLFTAPRAVLAELRDQNEQLRERFDELTAAHAESDRLRREAERARDVAERALRVKSDFLATVSHELRTPMNGVIGMSELLLTSGLASDQKEIAETLRDSAETMVGLIEEVLDFSKIEAGKLVLERAPFDLRLAIDGVLRMLSVLARRRGLTLTASFDGALPSRVLGDITRLRTLVTNLVGNALKFTERGVVELRAGLDDRDAQRAVMRVTVRDTGIGMSSATIARLFEPFTQADASSTRRYGGTGLGLAICKRLVTEMGGAIGVESTEGAGSTFWFTLPLQIEAPSTLDESACETVAYASAAQPSMRPSRPPPSTRPARPPLSMRPSACPTATGRPTVLVVDDNAVNLLVAARLLEKLNYEVDTAASGVLAVSACARRTYDAVLMDCHMPEMDGYEATARIRSQAADAARRTPVIALTADAQPDNRERCRAAGMDDYVTKPVRAETMRETLARWIKPPPLVA